MQISFFRSNLVLVAAMSLGSCSVTPNEPPITKVDQSFAAGGQIEMQLDGGDYSIRPSRDGHVRVTFTGSRGDASAALSLAGTRASLAVSNTPHNNFRATVEVPATADLVVHLSAGNLEVGEIAGNKDIESKAGNVEIAIPNSGDYAKVEASVKVGNLEGGPFGKSSSGLSPELSWSGSGKYSLRASLGAGNLELKR